MTNAEIARELARNTSEHARFVTKEFHDAVVSAMREDINEIKESQKWMMRLMVTQFFVIVVGVIVAVAQRGVP